MAYRTLVEDGHDGRTYELTGDTLITAREQVVTLARVLLRPIECFEGDIESVLRPMAGRGMPA